MRTPNQTHKAIESDLKHFHTALDRARDNKTRKPEAKARVVKLLSELITIYTKDKVENLVEELNKNSKVA